MFLAKHSKMLDLQAIKLSIVILFYFSILDVGWLQNIWRPDVFFKNAKQVTFHEMSVPNHYLWLYHDKTLIYMAKYVSAFSFKCFFFEKPALKLYILLMGEQLAIRKIHAVNYK